MKLISELMPSPDVEATVVYTPLDEEKALLVSAFPRSSGRGWDCSIFTIDCKSQEHEVVFFDNPVWTDVHSFGSALTECARYYYGSNAPLVSPMQVHLIADRAACAEGIGDLVAGAEIEEADLVKGIREALDLAEEGYLPWTAQMTDEGSCWVRCFDGNHMLQVSWPDPEAPTAEAALVPTMPGEGSDEVRVIATIARGDRNDTEILIRADTAARDYSAIAGMKAMKKRLDDFTQSRGKEDAAKSLAALDILDKNIGGVTVLKDKDRELMELWLDLQRYSIPLLGDEGSPSTDTELGAMSSSQHADGSHRELEMHSELEDAI